MESNLEEMFRTNQARAKRKEEEDTVEPSLAAKNADTWANVRIPEVPQDQRRTGAPAKAGAAPSVDMAELASDRTGIGGVVEILVRKYGCVRGQRLQVIGESGTKLWKLEFEKTIPKNQENTGWKWVVVPKKKEVAAPPQTVTAPAPEPAPVPPEEELEVPASAKEKPQVAEATTQESKLDGIWSKAVISGTTLTLRGTGEKIGLKIISPTELEVPSDGFVAVLKEDGKLHWSDGDIWARDDDANLEELDNRRNDRSEERSEDRQVKQRSPSTRQARDDDKPKKRSRSRSKPRGSDKKRRKDCSASRSRSKDPGPDPQKPKAESKVDDRRRSDSRSRNRRSNSRCGRSRREDSRSRRERSRSSRHRSRR